MDPDAFDRLTCAMSRLTTRRSTMLVASFLGLGGLAAAPDASEAGKKGKKKRKNLCAGL